jgi:hypothetical protein
MAPSTLLPTPSPLPTAKPLPGKASTKPTLTSGQHEPLFDLIEPYSSFPQEITGPTVWTREEFLNNPETWTYHWTASDIAEITAAIDTFIASGRKLTEISRVSPFPPRSEPVLMSLQDLFPLPTVSKFLATIKEDLTNGRGFTLLRGFPVTAWGLERSAIAYLGLGVYLGHPVSQNSRGHILGHVKDLFEDATQIDKVRIYRTNARQYFHCDDSDVVGLLCIAKALEGGESDVVSAHRVFNVLQKERPDVVETLTEPNWFFDRKGEVSRGQKDWIRAAVYYHFDGKVYSKWDPYFVRSLGRFVEKGLVPPLSEKQLEAIRVLEETCRREALHMVLEVGDIQFVSNNFVFHARTAYTDHAPPAPRRHLMRLWLSTPEEEGGWRLPFGDSGEKKRGGIQVDETPEVAPLDAE